MEDHELGAAIQEALQGSATACEKLSGFTLEAANLLRAGEVKEGNELLAQILGDLGTLVGLLADVEASGKLADETREKKIREVAEECREMLDQLKTVQEAQESQDWVYLADVLEYELAERVGAWDGFLRDLSGHIRTD